MTAERAQAYGRLHARSSPPRGPRAPRARRAHRCSARPPTPSSSASDIGARRRGARRRLAQVGDLDRRRLGGLGAAGTADARRAWLLQDLEACGPAAARPARATTALPARPDTTAPAGSPTPAPCTGAPRSGNGISTRSKSRGTTTLLERRRAPRRAPGRPSSAARCA